jgi:hypothetical protein
LKILVGKSDYEFLKIKNKILYSQGEKKISSRFWGQVANFPPKA